MVGIRLSQKSSPLLSVCLLGLCVAFDMAWETESKRVRGIAQNTKAAAFIHELPLGDVYVRFDKPEYDARAGKEVHGKLYETPEEAIQELSARVVERVLREGERVPVTVTITLPKWTED